jgi:hypothetical protein
MASVNNYKNSYRIGSRRIAFYDVHAINLFLYSGEKILEKIHSQFILDFNGYSMYPFLKPGDRLIVSKVPQKSLQVGDIVLVSDPQKKYVVHRLVKMLSPDKGILKGDSLLETDLEPVDLSTLTGKVVAILRKDRLIPLSTGLRSSLKKVYTFLSLNGLTSGAIRLRAKNILLRLFTYGKSHGYHKEWRFIIAALCNLSYQIDSNIDWIRIEEISSEEGVTGILYKNLKDSDVPQSALASLKNYYLSTAARNIVNINALDQLEDALRSERIEVMTLKGASLLNTIYPDIGMRPMGDLDLMVKPREQARFVDLLYSLGYKVDRLFPHFFKKDRVVIDLHMHALNIDRIASRTDLFPTGMDPVWRNSVPWEEDHQWLRRPDDMDNILLLSQHCMKHSFSKLIWLVDILKLIRNKDVMFWAGLLKRSNYLGQGKSLSYTLYLLDRIFSIKPTTGPGSENPFHSLSRFERGILEAKANGESIEFVGPIMSMSCVQGFGNKVALGWESLFPKNDIVKQGVTWSCRSKSVLNYPGRFWRILISLVKRFRLIFFYILRG